MRLVKIFYFVLFILLIGCSTSTTMTQRKAFDIHQLTPDNTAIVVIEFQKTWTEKGIFKWMIDKELTSRNVVKNTKQFLDKARKRGFPIIQAPLILDKSNKEQYAKMPFIPKFFNRFTANTWKAEFTDGIFKEGDLLVRGRCAFDACEGSNLEEIISDLDVQNLLFCGFTTEHCVEMTMKTLQQKGYNCVLVADCTATKHQRLQRQVEERQTKMYATDFLN